MKTEKLTLSKLYKNSLLLVVLLALLNNSYGQMTWTEVQTPVSDFLEKVYFVNDEVGWTYTANGKLLKSETEGLSWEVVYDDPSSSFWGMHWADENHGFAGGIETFIRTTDGGETWEDISFGDVNNQYDAVFFLDSLVGYVGVFNGASTPYLAVHKTVDGGENWDLTTYNLGGAIIHNFDFIDEDHGWLGSSGTLAYTTDGGDNWTQSITGSGEAYEWVDILDMDNAWAPTDSGEVNFTSDGTTWGYVDLTANDKVEQVEMLNSNFGVAVGEMDNLWFYNGSTWNLVNGVTGGEDIYGIWIEHSSSMWLSATNGKIYRGQVTPSDAKLGVSNLQDTICGETRVPIMAEIENQGDYTINDLNFDIYIDDVLFGSYPWSGNLTSTQIESIPLDTITISSFSTLKVEVNGDTVTYNNRVEHVFNYISDETVSVVSPVSGCVGETITLEASGGLSYLWYQAGEDGGDISADSEIDIELRAQDYYFVLIKQAYCQFQDSILIEFTSCANMNAFSPNNDGVNDFLFIEGLENAGNNIVAVFNRWGDAVNNYNNYDNEEVVWRGESFNGKALAAGTYYIVVNFDSGVEPYVIWVQIVR
ncbi:MAG: hypothetical protein BM555_00520 [Crocinitomix sp. MedPE-SWsnd]|nr:MAG: hypothetical protein BM555_00520 [Crocinitomix sp. MedPE-SWsnd]